MEEPGWRIACQAGCQRGRITRAAPPVDCLRDSGNHRHAKMTFVRQSAAAINPGAA
jgi:hypothetical protein